MRSSTNHTPDHCRLIHNLIYRGPEEMKPDGRFRLSPPDDSRALVKLFILLGFLQTYDNRYMGLFTHLYNLLHVRGLPVAVKMHHIIHIIERLTTWKCG